MEGNSIDYKLGEISSCLKTQSKTLEEIKDIMKSQNERINILEKFKDKAMVYVGVGIIVLTITFNVLKEYFLQIIKKSWKI